MKISFNKKAKQRIVSITTAIAIMANAVPLGGLSDIISPLFSLKAKAEEYSSVDDVTTDGLTQINRVLLGAAPTYTPTTEASEFVNTVNTYVSYDSSANNYTIIFSNMTLFLDYCWHYNHTDGFAGTHKNDILDLPLTNDTAEVRGIIPNTYEGLGNSTTPFDGTVKFAGSTFTIQAHRAFFGSVTDSVQILNDVDNQQTELILVRLSDVSDGETLPLLADNVIHSSGTADWKITLSSASSNTYSGVIGELGTNAAVKLNYTNNSSSADIESASDVGEICGTMQSGSSIELTYSAASNHGITSSGGNAGGIVGTMNGSSTLTIKAMPSVSLNAESTSAYAGGLVGELTSQATIDNQTGSTISVSGSIKGVSGAGGLFGHYTNYKTEFDLKDYNNTATVDGTYCGGVFGVLENNKGDSATSLSLTIKNTSNAGTLTANSGTTGNATGYFGGIAGKYITNALANSLILDNLTLTANANAAYSAFGGAIGTADSASYIQTTNTVSVTASGTTSSTYFGGLVGATSADNGVFIDLGSFTLSTGKTENNTFIAEDFIGGGVVGLFNSGVLRLSGTTTMTNAKPASAANCGQFVGNNDNVLVYAPSGGSWSFSRSSGAKTDDLGTWGEVVRGVDDSSSSNAIYFNNTDHTATVAAAETSMGSADDFIRTALNIQLNQGSNYDCLLFTSGSANTRDTLLTSANLSLSADISLAGTGIMGFMRDGGAVANIGVFTGTFDGNDHTITLAIGEKYGIGITSTSTGEGIGQIYRHQHNGLFAVLSGTVKELTVSGTINVSNCVDGMSIGGIASRNGGNVTLTKVIANETINYKEDTKVTGTEAAGKNIGGYIGFVGTNGTITINGVSSIGARFNLSGSHESWNVYGGAIGKITAGTFTVDIGTANDSNNKLTNSLTTDITGVTAVGSNGDGGGLIGYIASAGSYATRQVNINNLAISNCTVGNAANSTGGGFLGYSWLNTTTTIEGLTVSGTINNTAANKTAENVGVMLYSSTGKMVVNSLAVSGLTMSGGGGTSLGMIVNKAYTVNSSNVLTGGLYLDILNSGYSLTCTAPSSASGVFDEIAAYSAPDVISGGAGVISINMNTTRAGTSVTEGNSTSTQKLVNITQTGTYQNQLKTGDSCANPNSRYYYNIDNMSSSDAGQNLLLWSLNKYAYSGIKDEFVTTFNTALSGTADMTGLSFYPLASANDNYTIGALTLTFDYSGVNTLESGTGNTDSYVRDPAKANQHYLMHSGLFIDQPFGKSITITGKLSLGGTFLEDSTHKGVIISGTMKGNFICDSGSIELDGIKPMNYAQTTTDKAYKDGYLLINAVERDSDLSANAPIITIKNVNTTKKYSTVAYTANSTNATVAKSLIGATSGSDLRIVFSHIKLDARDGTGTDSDLAAKAQDLWTAYGTYNSIFTQSTLLESIHTNQDAVLEYNYTHDEDWGQSTRYVTYGQEVKTSVEYQDKENKYYGDVRNYTNPVSNTNTAYDFSSGFLKYVYADYNSAVDTNNLFYRELKVNVMTDGLTGGCGTYNDPYIITDNTVLENVAKYIKNGSTSDLPEIRLPKTAANYDTLAENTVGSRWCTGKNDDALYKPNTAGTSYTSTDSGATSWDTDDVRDYLANAYYQVKSNIELSSTFTGLGGTSPNTAFRGVIVGVTNDDGTPKYTITNTSPNPFINVTNGCVVKDVNIVVANSNITRSQIKNTNAEAYFGYASACEYYGGIIGEIMGGDNIIDNSYVNYQYTVGSNTQQTQITLSGASATIVPVGGYVGVIVYGGLIFKNMTATETVGSESVLRVNNPHLAVYYNDGTTTYTGNNLSAAIAKEAIYVNPIVGRVINGYAVNETETNTTKGTTGRFSISEDGTYHDDNNTSRPGTVLLHTLKNGKKHYSIADINKSETNKLDVTAIPSSSGDGNINVPNAQALFVLSLITQSGAGTATEDGGEYVNSLSYGTNSSNVYGMSRNATYNDVGTDESSSSDYSTYVSGDTAANTAVPYIIKHYTEIKERTVGGEIDHGWTLSFDDNGTTKYLKLSGSNAMAVDTNAYYFEGVEKNNGKWRIYGKSGNNTLNIMGKWSFGFASTTSTTDGGVKIDLYDSNGNLYESASIDGGSYYISNLQTGQGDKKRYYLKGSAADNRFLEGKTDYNEATLVAFNHVVEDTTQTLTPIYARCVTSTLGYYNINLTGGGTYQLPDSFRGLGCVGRYDTATDITNPYSIKLNTFDGNNLAIDEDIYLNKFYKDNYFNVLHKNTDQTLTSTDNYKLDAQTECHGIGLFDSVIMKSGGKFYNFTIKGSVKTAIFVNDYSSTAKEFTGLPTNEKNEITSDSIMWHSTGGVCGWSRGSQAVNFNNISLDNMIINGSNYVGGLLAHSGNNTNSLNITVTECSASAMSLKIAAAEKSDAPRNAMGTFVGKVKQGKVIVYGTSSGANNTNPASQSEVTIKSYSFGNNTQNFYVSVGGIVGYSGHGFEAYDMKVTSSDTSGTTIGNANTGICGGVIGVMQPFSENNDAATAIFKNCTVQNINVQGNMAGGIYGGKWLNSNWVPYRIEMINCNVEGKSSSAKNSITGGGYAGGLVGNGIVYTRKDTTKENANIIISDCKVSNYNIISNTNGYSGGFVGYCNSVKESITCYIHDSSVENCIIGQSGEIDYAGGAVGGIAKKTDNNIVGYNIKLDNVTSSSSRMGAWVGFMDKTDTDTTIQFTGMAIYGTGYDKNIGNWTVEENQANNNASFVFADYIGQSKTYSGTTVSNYNRTTGTSGNSVDMPKYPYVNINPQIGMGTGQIISGDGAVLGSNVSGFTGTGKNTLAAKIYADISDSNNTRRYTTFSDLDIVSGTKINAYMNRAVTDDGDRISTYGTEKGSLPSGITNDFAVVVIANQTDTETTNLINRYIQLVTNTTNDYTLDKSYYNIDVKTCKYDNSGKFVIDSTAANHGITFTKGTETVGGSFALNGAYADSNNTTVPTFTLVDVQFKDPLDTTKIAYHLYVPIYTIKQMEVGFSVAVKTGSGSVSYTSNTPSTDYSSLMSASGTHIDSLETWVTQYIRFTYNAGDLNALLQRGKVDWNHDKYVNFVTQSAGGDAEARLPDGTFMVLIDPNGNGDREYYAYAEDFDDYAPTGKPGWIIDLEKFKQGTNTFFEVQNLNAVMARNIDYTPNSSNTGLYNDVTALVAETPTTAYDVYRIDSSNNVHYYKYTSEGNGDSNLTISSNVNEDYYISMYVPKESTYNNELYYYSITGPSELTGFKNAKVNANNSYNVLVADLYTQETTNRMSVSPDDQQINASNRTIYVRTSTSITINNDNARSHLNGVNLYHSFDLTLNRHTESAVLNDIIGLGDSNDTSRITATYSIGSQADKNSSTVRKKDLQANYLNIETAEIMSDLITASTNGESLVVSSYIEMNFDESKLEAEFPEKSSENTIGVNVTATSNLAYDESRLAYTSMSVPFTPQDTHYYYRESVNSAKLDYAAVTELDDYDKIGKMSQNQSRLGVNGYKTDCYQQQYMPINTEAKYNVSAISESDLSKAEKLRLTISLSKKTDTIVNGAVTKVEYVPMSNMLTYLNPNVLITSGSSYSSNLTISDSASSLVVDIPFEQCSGEDNIYTIGVDFSAKTGTGFYEYANYMVTLRTELIYTDEQSNIKAVENSGISDYVVYTNAKVFPTLISNAS